MEISLIRKLTVFTPPQPEGFPDLAREEAMSGVRTIAYEEGYLVGRAEAAQEAQAERIALDKAILELAGQLNRIVADLEDAQQRALHQVLSSLLPKLCEAQAGAEIIDIINKVVTGAFAGQLCVTGNAALLGQIKMQVADTVSLNLLEDETYSDLTARLTWQGGGASIDMKSVIESCLMALAPAGKETSSKEIL